MKSPLKNIIYNSLFINKIVTNFTTLNGNILLYILKVRRGQICTFFRGENIMRKEKKKVLKKISKKRYAIIAGSLIAHKVRCPIILPTKLFDKLYREKLEST